MRCHHCGSDIDSDLDYCSVCHETSNSIQVLPPTEREEFDGITIETDESNEQGSYEYEHHGPNHHVYVKHINLNPTRLGIFQKLFIITALAILAFLILPIVFIIVIVIGCIWFLTQLVRSGR